MHPRSQAWKGKGKGKGDSKPKLDKPKLVNKPSGGKWVEEFKNEAFEQYYKVKFLPLGWIYSDA